jgi:hypothetical protein
LQLLFNDFDENNEEAASDENRKAEDVEQGSKRKVDERKMLTKQVTGKEMVKTVVKMVKTPKDQTSSAFLFSSEAASSLFSSSIFSDFFACFSDSFACFSESFAIFSESIACNTTFNEQGSNVEISSPQPGMVVVKIEPEDTFHMSTRVKKGLSQRYQYFLYVFYQHHRLPLAYQLIFSVYLFPSSSLVYFQRQQGYLS